MPEVYIDSLSLENFGPFYGEHSFTFGTLEGRSGILVGGKNGAGKTHLLRALYLAVVGETGVVDLKKVEPASEATRFVFEKSLNRRALSEGQDTVRLEVSISQRDEKGGASRKATLAREIRHRPNSPPVWRSYAERDDGSARIEEFIEGREVSCLVVEDADDSSQPFVYPPTEVQFPDGESFYMKKPNGIAGTFSLFLCRRKL